MPALHASTPDPSTPRSRAHAYQVFISSTFIDLAAERKAVRDALSDLNTPLAALGVCLIPVDLQGGADDQPPAEVCLQRIEECDLVVTLLGLRAGALCPDGRSITECEFDHAQTHGVPRLVYVRDNSTPILAEHVDRDDNSVSVLNRFKEKVDSSVKRDTFRSPEHLRGHVLRDVLSWILNQPSVRDRLAGLSTPSSLPEIKKYLDAIHVGDVAEAVKIVTSRRFFLDMRRFGTQSIHRELLRDLLELGSLAAPTRVVDPLPRSRLLLDLLSTFPDSSFAFAALQEAKSLEKGFNSSKYSFHVARAEAELHTRCGSAMPALKRMLRCAWNSGDIHGVAQAKKAIAEYYGSRGEHLRARRWYWRSICALCRMTDMCPHCLGLAFLGEAGESLNCHECETIDNRLLKAYLIARIIPDRGMQRRALLGLSIHLAAHNLLDQAVACAVLAARLAKQSLPEDAESGLSVMLATLIVEHGRKRISEVLSRVESRAEAILTELIDLHQVADFTNSLKLSPSSAGDHW